MLLRRRAPGLLALVAVTALPATVAAHTTSNPNRTSAVAPTDVHSRAHAIERKRLLRWAQLSAGARRRAAASARRRARAAHRASMASADPAQDGTWTAPFSFPGHALHAVLLPTGKVLFWGYGLKPSEPRTGVPEWEKYRPVNQGVVGLWDPVKGTGTDAFVVGIAGLHVDNDPAKPQYAYDPRLAPPKVDVMGRPSDAPDALPAPVYCSGQSLLPDGKVLMSGGNLYWPGKDYWSGHRFAYTFDPFAYERGTGAPWQRSADMLAGRWYPSQVLLADGRTAVLGGYREDGDPDPVTGRVGGPNDYLELFSHDGAGGGSFTRFAEGDRKQVALYPHLFLLPNAKVLLAGPGQGDSALFDPTKPDILWDADNLDPVPAPGSYPTIADGYPDRQNRIGSSAVLVPTRDPAGAHRVLQIGGFQERPSTQDFPATATTEIVDGTAPVPMWQRDAALGVGRAFHNTQILPDGSLVTVGGGYGEQASPLVGYTTGGTTVRRAPELYDPANPAAGWRRGAPQSKDRTYHSVALMLPDGRVLSTGDDVNNPVPTGELYTPPQHARGAAPEMTDGAPAMRHGSGYRIATPHHEHTRAVLMAPGATTHGADMHQRHVELDVRVREPGAIHVGVPPSTAVAPPGHYLLFLVDATTGRPSAGRWVHLDPDAPGQELPRREEPRNEADPPGSGKGARIAPKLRVSASLARPVSRSRSRSRADVRVRVSASRPATVTVTLATRTRGGSVLARGRVKVGRRAAVVRLKPTRAGKRRLAKLRRPSRLALRLRAVEPTKQVATRTVKVVLRG